MAFSLTQLLSAFVRRLLVINSCKHLTEALEQFFPNMDPVERCPISTWALACTSCMWSMSTTLAHDLPFTDVYLIGIWIGEALLGLIVWAVWLKNRYLTVIMPIAFTAVSVIGLIGLSSFVKSIRRTFSRSIKF